MKVTICASIAFYENMLDIKLKLEKLGHMVNIPIFDIKSNNFDVNRKEEVMKLHFLKIELCDAILVLNYDKNEIENYIGPNTLIEIGLAFYLKKKIYLLNSIPEISYKEEILGMKPIVISADLKKVK